MLKNLNVTLHATGGVAVYKVADLCRELIKQGANVKVTMTDAAQEFVTPLLFQILSKNEVYTDLFFESNPGKVNHIDVADWTDLAIIAPATANTIAKVANGFADDFTTTTLLATTAPVFVIPAMNMNMLNNPSTQANLGRLQQRDWYIMDPDTGFLAEGYSGRGRYPEKTRIMNELDMFLKNNVDPRAVLKGKKMLITAGGTREKLDPVRYLTNASSGKMGHELARVAAELGADVTLVTASSLEVPRNIRRIQVESAMEMYKAVDETFDQQDILIMAAAVSDYRPAEEKEHKTKKVDQEGNELTIHLEENPDILKEMGKRKSSKQITVGFAAETKNIEAYARAKVKSKNLDFIVANDVSQVDAGFNVDTNEVLIINREGNSSHFDNASKTIIANQILNYLNEYMREKGMM